MYGSKKYLETKVATSRERDLILSLWGSGLFVLDFSCLRRDLHSLYWPLPKGSALFVFSFVSLRRGLH